MRKLAPLPCSAVSPLSNERFRRSVNLLVYLVEPFVMDLPIAVPAKCGLREVIRFLTARKVPPIGIHSQLCQVYGEGCMDIKNVRKWVREFKQGRTNIHDEERSGRPTTAITDAMVEKIDGLVRENRRITTRELCLLVPDISKGSIQTILSDKLMFRKVCARWVPRMLTEDHKRQRMEASREFLDRYAEEGEEFLNSIVTGDETWVSHFTPETKRQSLEWRHTTSPKPRKFKQVQSARKVMATVFWYRKGVLLVDFMPRGTTINAIAYCETLTKLRRAIQNRRRGMLTKGVSLLHDNARPHVANSTKDLLNKFGWDTVTHPPYSPDMAPSDYHLFTHLKEHMSGKRFDDDDEVKEEVQRWLEEMAADFYNAGIIKLPERLQKCIDREGDYVEK